MSERLCAFVVRGERPCEDGRCFLANALHGKPCPIPSERQTHVVARSADWPTQQEIDYTLRSLSKAWPVLAEHAPHIDGEFDNAMAKLKRMLAVMMGKL